MNTLLIVLLALALITAILVKLLYRSHSSQAPSQRERRPLSCGAETCCGGGTHCQRERRPATPSIVYYEDEELDRLRHRDPQSYSPEEKEEIREVYTSLRPAELKGWLESIKAREIALAEEQQQEILELLRQEKPQRASSGA